MSKAAIATLEPRKTPRQARSTASVEAILQATVQVLLRDGRAKLTTTRVAERAGVSVGTLYQYFPNKSSLLQALLKEHLDGVALAVETACEGVRGGSLQEMAEAVVGAFVRAKFRNLDASVVLYAVSDDVEGKRIARAMHSRGTAAMGALFRTARERSVARPEVVAATLLAAMAGVSRALLEGGGPKADERTMRLMEGELIVMMRAYLEASAAGDFRG